MKTPSGIISLTNQAKVDRKDASDHPGRKMAAGMMEKTAKCLVPDEVMNYQGSFAVHMFQHPGQDMFAFVCQLVGIQGIPEEEVDVALKELRRQLMASYGREEKTKGKI